MVLFVQSGADLIIFKQVILSKEVCLTRNILSLLPPSKTVKNALSMISTLPGSLVHPQLPSHQLPLALLAGHNPEGVGHLVQGHALLCCQVEHSQKCSVAIMWCNLKIEKYKSRFQE